MDSSPEEAYPPVFLTGKLPKRNPEEILWLILCVGRMGIKVPRDIYKFIYEFLREVTYEGFEMAGPQVPLLISTDRDFVILKPEADGHLYFNQLRYKLRSGKKYFLCPGLLDSKFTDIKAICNGFIFVDYWKFVDRASPLCLAYHTISTELNSNIDTKTLQYVKGRFRTTIIKDNPTPTTLKKKCYPEGHKHIDLCIKHGLICYGQDIPEVVQIYEESQKRLHYFP